MIFSKILAGGLALSLAACGILYVLLERSQAEVATLKTNNAILTSVNEQNQKTVDRLTDLAKANAESIEKLGQENNAIQQQTIAYQTEIAILRATEAQLALKQPFERGNASRDRIATQLLRFSAGTRTDDSGDGQTDDSTGTDTP